LRADGFDQPPGTDVAWINGMLDVIIEEGSSHRHSRMLPAGIQKKAPGYPPACAGMTK